MTSHFIKGQKNKELKLGDKLITVNCPLMQWNLPLKCNKMGTGKNPTGAVLHKPIAPITYSQSYSFLGCSAIDQSPGQSTALSKASVKGTARESLHALSSSTPNISSHGARKENHRGTVMNNSVTWQHPTSHSISWEIKLLVKIQGEHCSEMLALMNLEEFTPLPLAGFPSKSPVLPLQ